MDDHYAINVAKTELRESYKSGEVDRILALFADNFTDMSGGLPTFWGIDAKTMLRARLEKLFRDNDVELTPIVIGISIAGNLAVEHGWHQMTRRPKAGGPMQMSRTRYVEVWRRGADRAWRIVLFIDNPDQKPELVEDVFQKS